MVTDEISLPDPAPLGLAGFGLTLTLLGLVHVGLFGTQLEMAIVPLAVVFGGGVQILVGLLSFATGDTFATTAFTSYGAFWVWFGLLTLFEKAHLILKIGDSAIGVVLLVWGVFTFYMWITTFRLNWAFCWLFFTVWVSYALNGFGALWGISWLVVWSGWVGIVAAASALYISFAIVMNANSESDPIPLGGTPYGG